MIHLIVAADKAGGIGKGNDLLCHISADLKHFKQLTMGHTIIMGRKTFESLPGVLPGRPHWLLTHQKDYQVKDPAVTIFHSLEDIRQALKKDTDYFVIGGASLYQAFLPLADSLYLTEIDHVFAGADTFFPDFDRREWQETEKEVHPAGGNDKYTFTFLHFLKK